MDFRDGNEWCGRAGLVARPLKRRRAHAGLSLIAMVIWIAALGVVGVTASKAVPLWAEFAEVRRVIKNVAGSGETDPTVIRNRFDLQASVASINTIDGSDLEIVRSSNGQSVRISVAYLARVELFGNAFLGFDFSTVNGE